MREIGVAPKVRLTVLHQHSDFPGLTTAALPACCSVSPSAILAIPAPSAIPALSLLSLCSPGCYPAGILEGWCPPQPETHLSVDLVIL